MTAGKCIGGLSVLNLSCSDLNRLDILSIQVTPEPDLNFFFFGEIDGFVTACCKSQIEDQSSE